MNNIDPERIVAFLMAVEDDIDRLMPPSPWTDEDKARALQLEPILDEEEDDE